MPTPTRALILVFLLAVTPLLAPGVAAQTSTRITGTFHISWGDSFDPAVPHLEIPTLVADDGRVYWLDVAAPVLSAHGGAQALAGRRVTLRVEAAVAYADAAGRESMPRLDVVAVERAEGAPRFDVWRLHEHAPSLAGEAAPAVTQMPYATLLCRYPDVADFEPMPKSRYEAFMSDAFPNVVHYWGHVSGGRLSLEGSRTFGWYTLPHPSTHYLIAGNAYVNHGALAEDCMAAADADVHFPDFEGIVVQVNGSIGRYGGFAAHVHSTRDQVTRVYKLAVMSSAADLGMYIHEIGHNLGLPHSGGQYGMEYDSPWDVMSGGRLAVPDGGATGVYTIAPYQQWLGWIPEQRRFVAPAGSSRVVLDPLDGPATTDGARIAVIPLPGGHAYTLEARRREGYDAGAPADAVIMHHVRSGGGRANLLDADGNGFLLDEGPVWRVGETFRDRTLGVEVSIDRQVGSGFEITIRTAGVDSIMIVPAGRRREVDFGAAVMLRDSAYVLVTGPNAERIRWDVPETGALEFETASGTGSGWLRWGWRSDGLAAGEHVEAVTLVAGDATPRTVTLADTLVVRPSAGLAAGFIRQQSRPDTLLVGQQKQDTWFEGPSAMLQVTGPGAQTAPWRIAARPAWLEVEPASGTGNAAFMMTRSAVGLEPGVYADTLRIEVDGATRPAYWVHRLVVLPPLEIVPSRAATSASVPQGTVSEADSVYVEVRGDWAATAQLQVISSGLTVAVDEPLIGSGWVRFRRHTGGRAPGTHIGRLTFLLSVDRDAAFAAHLVDTVHVVAAPPTIALIRSARRDTVHAGEWSESSVRVEPRGEGSTTYGWRPTVRTSRVTLLNWYGSELDPVRESQVGAYTLRWARNLINRQPGLNVDTLRFRFVEVPHLEFALYDTIWVAGTGPPPVVITSALVRPVAEAGAPYADTLRAAGGSGAYRWRHVAGALPAGFALDSLTGVLSGTPQQPGSHAFGVELRSGEQTTTSEFTLVVQRGALRIVADSVRPAGMMGAAYTDSLQAGGAGRDLRWRLTAGALPAGLALDSISGRVSGIAEASGSYSFMVEARSENRSASGAFRIDVGQPTLQPGAVLDRLLGGGSLSEDQVRFLDLLGNRNGRLDVGDVRAWLDSQPAAAADSAGDSAAEVAALRALLDAAPPSLQDVQTDGHINKKELR